jgi:hypothetical protein
MSNSSARKLSFAARVRYGASEHGAGPLIALVLILANGASGVALHYEMLPFRAHLIFSLLTTLVIALVSIQAIRRNLDRKPVRRIAMMLLSLTLSDALLGVGSYMNLLVPGTIDWFPVAHAVMGIAVFGAAIALAATVYARVRPADAELAHGGIAIA